MYSILNRITSMERMANALRTRQVSKGEFWCYVSISIILILFFITEFFGVLGFPFIYQPAYLKTIEFIVTLAVILITLGVAYHENKQGDNQDFWYRYFSLSMSMTVITAALAFLIGLIGGGMGLLNLNYLSYNDLAVECLMYALIIYWTHKYMRKIAMPKSA